MIRRTSWACLLLLGTAHAASLSPQQLQAIDAAAAQTLRLTGVPAASIAVVRDGAIVDVQAYGMARLPDTAATPDMAFAIGSISKQFTAALILLLAQDGKLSLDDHVGRFLPELTQANEVTIRQILSHTAGYQDFWPEDYSPLIFRKPSAPIDYVDKWGRKKLDFPPGTAWQYSNTGFAIAGLIAEKAVGVPLFDQLRTRILEPLHMNSAADYAYHGTPPGGPLGYERYAFGPPRPAPLDVPAWSFGSGGLAMTPHDLALWDISMMNRSVLSPASYDAMETEIKLKNGQGTGYGLGVSVGSMSGHRIIEHSGEETGFVAENIVFPDDHNAIVVLTNQDASRAAAIIARQVAQIAFGIAPEPPSDKAGALVMAQLIKLADGHVDMGVLNANAQSYFSATVLADYKSSLSALGQPLALRERKHEDRGGMVFHVYDVAYPGRMVRVTTYELPDGKLDQLLIEP
jgi:CubicO group peptidase (beta-lactamase class C family)